MLYARAYCHYLHYITLYATRLYLIIYTLIHPQPLVVSILSERRALAPYGLSGGENGQKGLNLLKIGVPPPPTPTTATTTTTTTATTSASTTEGGKEEAYTSYTTNSTGNINNNSGVNYRTINIGAKNTVYVNNGDRLLIATPGGGGYGLSLENYSEDIHSKLNSNIAPITITATAQEEEEVVDIREKGHNSDLSGSGMKTNMVRISGSLADYQMRQESV